MSTRRLLLLSALALGAGCSKKSAHSGAPALDGGAACTAANADSCECASQQDCPVSFTCAPGTRRCVFQCTIASDCTSDLAPDKIRTPCQQSPLGCACEAQLGQCVTKVCGTDADCGAGLACIDAACTQAIPPSTADDCKIFPTRQAMRVGQGFTFTAQAYSGGKPIHLDPGAFSWAAIDPSVTAGAGGAFTGARDSGGDKTAVQATVNGHPCTATVDVYGDPNPATDVLRAVVVDELAGAPISGAQVQVEGAMPVVKATDARGVALFSRADLAGNLGGPWTVSVFADHFGYLTLIDTATSDLLVPLVRSATENEGGVGGTMQNLFTQTTNVHLGMVGMGIAASITDLSLQVLLGPATAAPTGLPAGMMLGFSTSPPFKGTYAALGAAGDCPDDPSGSQAGTCGIRSVWGLGGDVPPTQLSTSTLLSGSAGFDLGPILAQISPSFRDFNSTLVRDEELSLSPPGPDGGAGSLTPLSLDNAPVPAGQGIKLSLEETVKVPKLPTLGGSFVDGAMVLVGAEVAGRGLTPLGLAVAMDKKSAADAPDGLVTDEAGVDGQLTLHMAPAHGGAEGSPYRVAILAASFHAGGGAASSGLVTAPGSCSASPSNGICYGGTIDAGRGFMALPEGAGFSFSARAFSLPGAVAGADLARLIFVDAHGQRWSVYFDGSRAAFAIPSPPPGIEDRTRSDDTAAGPRSDFVVQALATGVGLDAAMAFNGATAGRLDPAITRFASLDYPPPAIAIDSPPSGATIAQGSAVAVTLQHDGANGNAWSLCWSGSSAPVTSTAGPCTQGGAVDASGKATANLPAVPGGTAQPIYLHAVLVNGSGAPLTPPAEASEPVTVQ